MTVRTVLSGALLAALVLGAIAARCSLGAAPEPPPATPAPPILLPTSTVFEFPSPTVTPLTVPERIFVTPLPTATSLPAVSVTPEPTPEPTGTRAVPERSPIQRG